MSGGKSNKQGMPQGGVISPLLANLDHEPFLNGAHVAFRNHGLIHWNNSPIARNGATRSPAAHRKMCRPVAINPLFFSRYRLCETKRLCGLAHDVIGVFLEDDVKRQLWL